MSLADGIDTAVKATHCGMCKIDFLGTGLCPAGKQHGYVAYWPEGRMEIIKALHEKRIQPTKKLVDIVESCTLCGICDHQCHFITNLRPTIVQKALKEYVKNLNKNDIQTVASEPLLKELQTIVGTKWATNDPVILTAYQKTILSSNIRPQTYVVMPNSTEEIAQIIKVANKHQIPFLPRGNGTFLSVALRTLLANSIGLQKGIILDLNRMKTISIDPDTWTARVGPGVSAFELQKAAKKYKMRAMVGEAEANICVNVKTFGIISTWGNAYGWGADNFIDVELVTREGDIIHQSDKNIENLYAADHGIASLTLTPQHIVTEMTIKLHPVFDDEEAVFIPFEHFDDAVEFAHNLAHRNKGISLAVLSSKYFSDFICPTDKIARDFEYIMRNYLHLNYIVDVICDSHDKKYIEQHAEVTIPADMMKTFVLGSPSFAALKDSELLKMIAEEENPLKTVFSGPMKNHIKNALKASPEQIAQVFDADLRDFFTTVYAKPEMTDPIWLHEFRILPSRMMRQHMFMVRGGYMKAKKDLIIKAHDIVKEVGDKYQLENAMGFISFIDNGKIAFLEYDYYYDHTNPDQYQRLNQAIVESLQKKLTLDGFLSIEYVFHKGLHRKEHVFYPFPKGCTSEELELFDQMVQQIVS
ncbi:MAG: FAD-binding protein [Candidatus Thermoplasmatota archaeon]|nr:FAD-binding protein [Candidatus Thermoplasmatota archaeon]